MEFTTKKIILIFLFFLSFNAFSQTDKSESVSISGFVRDTLRKEGIDDVVITVKNLTNKSTITNKYGYFELKNLPEGYYSLTFKISTHKLLQYDSIKVTSGKNTNLGLIYLDAKLTNAGGGGIKFTKPKATVTAAVQDVKKADAVSNVMSAEQMKNTQDNNSAAAAARIPGVTLMESRFIMLRGLSQRYNSVQINNINAPSTEVDKRAFSFDLIPSSMLDKIAIFKSPAGDLAGDFAGGVIKLQTKGEVEKDFVSYSIGLGYRINTSLSKHYNNSVGSATDYLGFDDGTRALPSSFPSNLADYSTTKRIELGKSLNNNFTLTNTNTPLDFGAGFGFGKNIKIKKAELFTVNNFSYSTNYQYSQMKRYRYQNDPVEYVRQMFNYTDDNLSIESKFSILSNWILKANKKTTFTLKNVFNQIGENETTIRSGINPTERPNDEFKNYGFHYTSRSIYFGQFEGNHKLKNKGEKLIYTLGFSNIGRNEPDYRRFRTFRAVGSEAGYSLIDPPSASLFDAARFYSKLKENTIAANLNYERVLPNPLDSNKNILIKAGAYAESKSRTFDARWISYSYSGDPLKKNDFLLTPIDQIFSAGNLNTIAGFKPLEGTNPSDKYTAANQLGAAYLNLGIPLNKLKLNAGLRTEYFNQTLESATNNGPVNITLTNLNLLPSFNAAMFIDSSGDKTLIRFGYGRTVNRPEFRELAPFVYYDFMYDVNIVGNENLKSATISNFDLRFEHYPSSSETFSLGVFYKKFLNPIENYVQPVGLSQQFTLKNAASATNYGIEMELRKSFSQQSQNKFIKKLSTLVNASYIISKVDLGNDSTLSQARTRPLQGQSPYIINAALQYVSDSGITVNVSYNIIGKRIVYVGNNIFPSVYEMPRHSLDITFVKEVSKTFTIKFGVSDVLNYKHQLWQDTDGDGTIRYTGNKDHQLLEYRRGQMINLGLSFKFR
jgi:hypothetical protein